MCLAELGCPWVLECTWYGFFVFGASANTCFI